MIKLQQSWIDVEIENEKKIRKKCHVTIETNQTEWRQLQRKKYWQKINYFEDLNLKFKIEPIHWFFN